MNSDPSTYDVIIIGAGPGGYVCAVRAAQLGLKTAVIEQEQALGGTCLNRGCIPTKALLHAADVLAEIKTAGRLGVIVGAPEVNMQKLHQYRKRVVTKNSKGVGLLLKGNGVEVHHGVARLGGAGSVVVQPADGGEVRTLTARGIVVASGSTPRNIPGFDFDGEHVLSSNEALTMERVPASLAVLGAGAVGVEFASIYSRLGSKVTLIELLPRIVPFEDEEVSDELERAFNRQGIAVMAGTRAESLEKGEQLTLVARRGDDEEVRVECEDLLVAVGRGPATDGIGLAEAGVAIDRGYIKVNARLQTAAPGIYAIGDVVALPDRPHPQLAHVASHEGLQVAEQIAGRNPQPLDYDQVPGCTYCTPEVASVGLTEAQAVERGHEVKIGKFPFSANSKSSVLLESVGFVKIVADGASDKVLGMHIIGPHATELIAEGVAALKMGATSAELAHAIHPHPTLSEAVGEAAHGVLGAAIHL